MPLFNGKIVVLLVLFVVYSSCETKVITSISPEQIKDVGESAELVCVVNNPNDLTVLWSKKSRSGPADSVVLSFGNQLAVKDRRFNLTSDGKSYTLNILNIEFSDTAIYECQVIESATVKHTANVELLVKHAPKVDNIEITPSSVAVNGSAQLKCLASGYPRPSIIWRRDNDAIMPGGGNSFTGNILTITEVKSVDRGLYYCIADNGVGTDRRIVNFDVEFPPQISVPRPKVAQALDCNIELECRVQGHPAPSVTWFKGDQELHNSGGYTITNTAAVNEVTSSVLLIESIENEQYGDYICKAINNLGSEQRRLNVFEQTFPNEFYSGIQRSSTVSIRQNFDRSFLYFNVVAAFIILTIFRSNNQ